ncbi:MAG TPA: response regulator [Roseiflexaceae bacterium]|nr:response regulator [Roseiflexaceae bacterium]
MTHATTQPTFGDVLIVDDDLVILNVIVKALVRDGYAVRRAVSGKEALTAILARLPALLLLDLEMFGLNGDELLVYVRTIYPHVPVVLITAYAERAQPLVNRYGVACMTKPFDLNDLLDYVARYVQPERANAVGQ